MIGVSHLLYRIKGNARTLATIAVLSASTITAMGTVAAISYEQKKQINNDAPFSYAYYNTKKDVNLDKKIEETIAQFPNHKLKEAVTINFLKIEGQEESVYKTKLERFNKIDFRIISERNFDEVIKSRGIYEKFSLRPGECILFTSYFYEKTMESYKSKRVIIPSRDEEIQLKIGDFRDYNLINSFMYRDVLVIKDELYKKLYDEKAVIQVRCINVENQKESKELTEKLEAIVPKMSTEHGMVSAFASYYSLYSETMISFGTLMFIGGFLSLVFLICTGSIIFFKQLAEANEDKERYKILKNIGVNRREIKSSIAKQLFFVFALPFVVAIIHSLVALSILQPLMKTNIAYPISVTIGFYTLIYFIYYLLTVNSYCKIVNGKE